MRRGPFLAGGICLAGAFMVLVAVGNAWVVVSVGESALLPTADLEVTGRDLRPGLAALGLVGLAGVPALAATRGRGRGLVGILLALTGLAVVAVVGDLLGADPGLVGTALQSGAVQQAGGRQGVGGSGTYWPSLTALGGLLLAAAGLLIAVKGRDWSALGRRYEAPTAPPPPAAERDLWEALDRGEDPTGAQDPPGATTEARD